MRLLGLAGVAFAGLVLYWIAKGGPAPATATSGPVGGLSGTPGVLSNGVAILNPGTATTTSPRPTSIGNQRL